MSIPDFKVLDNRVREAGLYERTYGRYFVCFGLIMGGIALAFYFLTLTDNVYWQMLNAVFFAFVLVQAGMLGHDLSHGQVFASNTNNNSVGVIMWGLVGGMSEGGWYDKHNAHHKHVNHDGLDPDLDLPFIFSNSQTGEKSFLTQKFILPYQHILFFILLPLAYPSLVLWSAQRIFSSFSLINILELILICVHFIIFFYVPFSLLPFNVAVVFLLVTSFAIGAYMGMVFAPNHKGETIVGRNEEHTWVSQITSTRNLYYYWPTFIIFSGLDLQVEHHLFPKMSRFNYSKAQKFVKEYCLENNIRYYETSWAGSMKEIYQSLKMNTA